MTDTRSKKLKRDTERSKVVYHEVLQGDFTGCGFPLGDRYYVHIDLRKDGTVKITATDKGDQAK